MTVAFQFPPFFDDVRKRLNEEVERFLGLDSSDLSPTKRYHAVLACVHAICAAIVDAEEEGMERDEIVEILKPVRAIHARSPFVDRLQRWPRGYPGDFETVEYICSGANRAPEGTIEHCCEQYALTRGIAQQHRNKVQFQAARIQQTMMEKPRASKVLLLACGSCPDLRSIEMLEQIAGEIWINDADSAALNFAQSMLQHVRDRIRVVPGNALSVARTAKSRFDLVMAGGLFDYLDDRAASLLIRMITDRLLAPGGVFFFTNIAEGNPYRPLIEYFGDWFLIERSEDDIRRLCKGAGEVTIKREASGLTHIIEVRR